MSFQIYDFDGDGMINTKDLTIVVSATMREQDIVMHKGTLTTILFLTFLVCMIIFIFYLLFL